MCALLITWGIEVGDSNGSIALAQEDNWTTEAAQKQGIRLVETRDPRGPAAYPAEPGDVLFFTNVGTSYGAKNLKNSVVVINAKTKKPIAVSDIEPGWSERWVSHGIGVSPDGKYVCLPGALRAEVNGWLAKIDMQTWKVVQSIPMHHYPLWTVFTQDGKWAWITNSHDSKVLKLERAAAPGQRDRVVAEVPTGPGPYGLAMSIDDKDLWVADKGETLPGQRGTSITIIDADANQVKRTIETKCITNDHLILSPDGREMWATCNQSHEVVVLDTKTYEMKTRIPMPNQGDTHGGSFVSYTQGPGGLIAETVSDQNGLHGSAREAARKGTTWVPAGSR